jgi:hypothetical protein
MGAPSTATTATQRVEEARKCTALLYRRWGIIRNVYESGTYSGGRSDAHWYCYYHWSCWYYCFCYYYYYHYYYNCYYFFYYYY